VVAGIEEAAARAREADAAATHLVVGLAPDGGRLAPEAKRDIGKAVRLGLHVDCGLHDYLTDDVELVELARSKGVRLRDIRKPPPPGALHFFSGKIEEVKAFKVAVLGTDSAVGKRTTAWLLVNGLEEAGRSVELVGTGQTAWMQGARYGLILDALVNDFVAGEIEHAVWSAWVEARPDLILVEGQGSLMNPAYPGGFEILAAARPDAVVLQHAPARKEYDGFPGYQLHDLPTQIRAIELISGRPVVAVTVNHEGLAPEEVAGTCAELRARTGLPAADVLLDGPGPIVETLLSRMRRKEVP
jgi:uncharacterized NAD-dependent epimerase/dehydratase family protein